VRALSRSRRRFDPSQNPHRRSRPLDWVGQCKNFSNCGRIRLTAFAPSSNGGLIVTVGALAQTHRDLIITLAARQRLPAVYPYRFFVAGGGLISYGPDSIDPWRRAAGYVDRILKGAKPADLPVLQSTKFELVINLQAARMLGLEGRRRCSPALTR
jgi:hypothetical protein